MHLANINRPVIIMSTNGDATNRNKPLKVLIAGGGIGGLAAAIFLRHAGHTVEVRRFLFFLMLFYLVSRLLIYFTDF